MYQLIEIYMGEAAIVDSFALWGDCLRAALNATYVADGMATYVCEALT